MANLYENLPEEQTQALANEQKRRIAEAMMAQGLEAQTPYTSAGRYVVPMHWTQGLAKVAQAMLGAYGIKQAQKGQEDIAKQVSDKQRAAYDAYKAGTQAPQAMTPSALRPEGVALEQQPGPAVGTVASALVGQAAPRVAPAAQPTEQDQTANDATRLANLESFMGNRYANPQAVQAAGAIETLRGTYANRDEQRQATRQNALLAAQVRLEELNARMEDRALTRAQQSELARQANDTRLQIAQMTKAMTGSPAYRDIIDPKDSSRLITIDGKLYQPGGTLGDPGVIGIAGKDPSYLKKEEQRGVGRQAADQQIATLRNLYDELDKGGGIVNPDKSALSNVKAWTASTGVGQTFGGMVGTDNQTSRDTIAMTRPALLRSIMSATGMSARNVDSNAELKLWLSTATDPTKSVKANRAALDNLERFIGSGGTFTLVGKHDPVKEAVDGVDVDNALLRTTPAQ